MIDSTQTTLFDTSVKDNDDLFALTTHICADCGQSFATSRGAKRCATCASLRTGVVGAATVACPGCNVEHQIPILAPHKLCARCFDAPHIAAAALRARLAAVETIADTAYNALSATLRHARPADYARYAASCDRAAEWPADRWQRARDAAIAKGDGLSPLLSARLARDDAAAAADRVRAEVEQGLAEIEHATR